MTAELGSLTPYPGPRPFEREEQNLFFGRDREVSELLSLIIAHRIVLLYAQSGAGKTSLLHAGIIPSLTEEGFAVQPVARVRGLIPEDIDLGEISNIYVFNRH
jgi:Novel STAND NTPase 1